MAVAPMFVASMDVLKTRLRLEGAKTPSALGVIDQAVQDVALGFHKKLGLSRITALQAIPYDETPDSEDDFLRLLANSVEQKWVRLLLLRRLPSLFVDASGMRQQAWNDEAGFNAGPEKFLQNEIDRLQAEIDEALVALSGDEDLDEDIVNVSTIGPDTTPDLPGASVWPGRRNSG